MQRRILTFIIVAVLAVGLAACGSSSKKSSGSNANSPSSGTPENTITISNFKFQVGAVKAGATVTVKNQDSTTHTVTSDAGKFNSGNVNPSSSQTFTAPAQPGSYPFHCNFHNFMTATLVVT